MVLDLENYKFYVNYFGLMPYLVNKENQNNLAYIDFSKYKDFFKMSIRRSLLNILKLLARFLIVWLTRKTYNVYL